MTTKTITDDEKQMLNILVSFHHDQGLLDLDDPFRASVDCFDDVVDWDAYTQEKILDSLGEKKMIAWKWGSTMPRQRHCDRFVQMQAKGWDFFKWKE